MMAARTPVMPSAWRPVHRVRGGLLLAGFLILTVVTLPVQLIALRFKAPAARTIPFQFHRAVCALLGIRIEQRGEPARDGPLLFVANHTSWLDIPILSAAAPVSFVAKSEVAAWPFFGLLAKLQRTVFVDRQRRSRTDRQRDAIHARLGQGDRLILFPEGTSSDGNRVLPFNSALFSVAELEVAGAPVSVQPVSLAYTRLHGLPIGREGRPLLAWYGDMELLPHFWGFFASGPIDVVLHFHPPVTITAFASRKALARHCQEAVAAGVTHALTGRPEGLPPVHIARPDPLGAAAMASPLQAS